MTILHWGRCSLKDIWHVCYDPCLYDIYKLSKYFKTPLLQKIIAGDLGKASVSHKNSWEITTKKRLTWNWLWEIIFITYCLFISVCIEFYTFGQVYVNTIMNVFWLLSKSHVIHSWGIKFSHKMFDFHNENRSYTNFNDL